MARPVTQPSGWGTEWTTEEYHAHVAKTMSETALEDCVLDLAGHLGWLRFHALPVTNRKGRTRTAQRGDIGFPDLVLVHPLGALVVRELKSERGSPSPEQKRWLAGFTAAGVDTGIWKPRHWFDGTIRARLSEVPPSR